MLERGRRKEERSKQGQTNNILAQYTMTYLREDKLATLEAGKAVVNDDHLPLPVSAQPHLVGPHTR